MTIDKAIEILKGTPGPQFILEGKDAWRASQLAIEALTQVLDERDGDPPLNGEPLPSETDD